MSKIARLKQNAPAPLFSMKRKAVQSSALPSPLTQWQRALGNQAYGQFLQAKLAISQPGDRYEQEADRVSNHMMRSPVKDAFVPAVKGQQTSVPGSQGLPTASSKRIFRKPKGGSTPPPKPELTRPPDEVNFSAKDLLVYPLIVDLWNDIFRQKLTDKEKKELKLKGTEGAAIWNLIMAGPQAGNATQDSVDFGEFLESWMTHAEEIHKLAGGSDFYLDLFSRFVDINIESYFGSDLFKKRLKSRASSLVTILVLAQGILSTVQAVKEPGAEVGEFEPTQWEKQFALVKGLFNIILKEQIKAPDFFNIGPLKLSTHPTFAATSLATGAPSELAFEMRKGQGEGQGGEQQKFALTVNIPQIIGMFSDDSPSASDLADLQKNRSWQGSVWGSFDRTIPTLAMQQAGKLPVSAFRTGTIVGSHGVLTLLEGGGRYGGNDAQALTAWFLRGGSGYQGKKGKFLQKIGFNAIYTDWKEQDILAPRLGPNREPVGGHAFRLTPFANIEFGSARHKFSAGAALGFVTGKHEGFDVSDFRGNFSYTYMGDRTKDELPVFKLDLANSVSRLDWWNPDSPLMVGAQARASFNEFFLAGQINTGAGKIPERRAEQIGDKAKVQVPTAVLFTGGVKF